MKAAGLIFSLDAVYLITGLVLVCFAILTGADRGHPRRWGTGAFWLILGGGAYGVYVIWTFK